MDLNVKTKAALISTLSLIVKNMSLLLFVFSKQLQFFLFLKDFMYFEKKQKKKGKRKKQF